DRGGRRSSTEPDLDGHEDDVEPDDESATRATDSADEQRKNDQRRRDQPREVERDQPREGPQGEDERWDGDAGDEVDRVAVQSLREQRRAAALEAQTDPGVRVRQ